MKRFTRMLSLMLVGVLLLRGLVVVLSEFSQTSKIGRIFWNCREPLRRLNLNKKTVKNPDFTRLLTVF
ncbi:hypothetical protein DFP94_102354 [Fontibacillus phaseoli]|uniref:Uncharacterized protein n=1 Tax=Fontibacillus phaseoli TaxID=1416533 RepID=A0A369BJ25_9BACL|nr:hypothetical protein DFP94_102354 [Fontibacillus phaseoli]